MIFVPDVILLDLLMVRKPGIDVVPEIRAKVPHTRVLALHNMREQHKDMDEDLVYQALLAGAHGVTTKLPPLRELAHRVREVHAGRLSLAAPTARRLIRQLNRPTGLQLGDKLLDKRDAEVLVLIARGIDVEDIAQKLSISEQTVYDHIASLINTVQQWPRGNLLA